MFELDNSLKKIARGASLALIGTALGLFFNFIVRLIIARYGSQANYGIFSLALVVLNFAVMLAGLGLVRGITRYIAYFRGKDDAARVRANISESIKLSGIASLVLGLAIFFAADTIALKFFHTPELVLPLKIFAAGIPFFTMIQVLVAIFRGFDRVEPTVIFQYIMLNILVLIFLSVIIVIGLPFISVFYAYLAALIMTFIVLAAYAARKIPQPTATPDRKGAHPITKELLLFSLPLMGTAIVSMLITWTDTLMLGYFKTPKIVGLYNAAHPLVTDLATPKSRCIAATCADADQGGSNLRASKSGYLPHGRHQDR